MKVLAIDIGGNSVKVLVTPETEPRKFPSGPTLTPRQMVSAVLKLTDDWHYDAVSIGFPGRVRDNQRGLRTGQPRPRMGSLRFREGVWSSREIINDAAMQALGSYRSGKMLFLGLGTGLGSALIVDGNLMPMELGQLPYKDGTYESNLGLEGLKRLGITKWREYVQQVVVKFISALELDDVVIGGGNVAKLDKLPAGCRAGDNAHAFRGGFLLWEKDGRRKSGARLTASSPSSRKN